MTMPSGPIVTRADGQPAWVNARPRKRQSDFNRKRRYAEMGQSRRASFIERLLGRG